MFCARRGKISNHKSSTLCKCGWHTHTLPLYTTRRTRKVDPNVSLGLATFFQASVRRRESFSSNFKHFFAHGISWPRKCIWTEKTLGKVNYLCFFRPKENCRFFFQGRWSEFFYGKYHSGENSIVEACSNTTLWSMHKLVSFHSLRLVPIGLLWNMKLI